MEQIQYYITNDSIVLQSPIEKQGQVIGLLAQNYSLIELQQQDSQKIDHNISRFFFITLKKYLQKLKYEAPLQELEEMEKEKKQDSKSKNLGLKDLDKICKKHSNHLSRALVIEFLASPLLQELIQKSNSRTNKQKKKEACQLLLQRIEGNNLKKIHSPQQIPKSEQMQVQNDQENEQFSQSNSIIQDGVLYEFGFYESS